MWIQISGVKAFHEDLLTKVPKAIASVLKPLHSALSLKKNYQILLSYGKI